MSQERTTTPASRSIRIAAWPVLLILLLLPMPSHPAGRLPDLLHDMIHFPILAVFAWSLLRRGLTRRVTLAASAAVILVTELIQPLVGREAAIRDVLFGLAGAMAIVAWNAAGPATDRRRCAIGRAIGIGVTAAALCPLLVLGVDRWESRRSFPLLASFRSPLEVGRWSGQACSIRRVRREGQWALRVRVTADQPYPGVFLVEVPHDWSAMEVLQIRLFWPGTESREFWARADDRRGSPPYADRVQTSTLLKPGINCWVIRLADWERTPGGRRFDLSRVATLGLFFDSAAPGEFVDLLEIRLVPDSPESLKCI